MTDENRRRAPLAARTVVAGAVVGLLDGAFATVLHALVLHTATATQVWQSVAKALLGKASFDGGGRTAALGLLLHFCVALGWTLVYRALLAASAGLRGLTAGTAGALAVGALYGPLVWTAMNQLVIPLTQARSVPVASSMFLIQLVWHVFGVGLPIALLVRAPAAEVPLQVG
jgi:hypothetical protein